jgi:hypothetical protein
MVKRDSVSVGMKVFVGTRPDLVGDIQFRVPEEVTVFEIAPKNASGQWQILLGVGELQAWYPPSQVFLTRDAFIYKEGCRLMHEIEKATSAKVRILTRFLSHVTGGEGLHIREDPSEDEEAH